MTFPEHFCHVFVAAAVVDVVATVVVEGVADLVDNNDVRKEERFVPKSRRMGGQVKMIGAV